MRNPFRKPALIPAPTPTPTTLTEAIAAHRATHDDALLPVIEQLTYESTTRIFANARKRQYETGYKDGENNALDNALRLIERHIDALTNELDQNDDPIRLYVRDYLRQVFTELEGL